MINTSNIFVPWELILNIPMGEESRTACNYFQTIIAALILRDDKEIYYIFLVKESSNDGLLIA